MRGRTIVGAVILFWLSVSLVAAQSEQVSDIVSPTGEPLDPDRTMILFYSDACPHCHNQLEWMAEIEEDFPRISFERFEIQVSNDRENQEYFQTVMEAYGSNARGWPRTVIGDRVFIGFAAETGEPIYNEDYQAWIGYRNQLRSALEQLHDAGGTES